MLIVVTGFPATGKTTFARKLSTYLGIPLFSKDDLKELLHESFGAADREASRKLGVAAYSLLRNISQTMLASNQSLILESNFDAAGSGPWIIELEERYSPTTVQLILEAQPSTIMQRFSERSDSRHAAHFDNIAADELKSRLAQPYEPLAIKGTTMRFDTTDFGTFNSCNAIERVMALLPGKN